MAKKKTLTALDGFSDFITQTLKDWKVPGAAVAIVKDGAVVFSEGFGYRNVAKKLPVTPDTLFAIGSSSKAFTATSVGMMVDAGKLEWDTPVKRYLPTFKMHDAFATERMTPRDLLCHRSGLPRHDLMWYNSTYTRQELFDRLEQLQPNHDFRTHFQYQNFMFMTAGYLAGEVAGTGWEALVRQRIFKPLGMKTSNFSVDDSQKTANFSLPYREKDGQVREIPFRNIDAIGPAGSINSCVSEMVHWVLLQLNHGKHGKKQIISEATLKQLHSSQMVVNDPTWHELFLSDQMTYGMGWIIQPHRGHTLISHGGNIDGFSAQVAFMPEINAGAVILTNLNSNMAGTAITHTLFDRLRGLEPVDWSGKFKALYDKLKAAAEQAKSQSASDRKPNTQPSHPLADYVGDYQHPGYGALSVTRENDQLTATYNRLPMRLAHYHYDVFEGTVDEFEIQMKIAFSNDLKGNVERLAIQLEPAVDPIVFVRMADKAMQNQGFLEPFTGTYELMGMPLKVTLKGDHTLIASMPGQPEFELVAYQGTTFNIKGQSGFSLEFKKDAKGAVSEVLVTQPNGSFTAQRKTAE